MTPPAPRPRRRRSPRFAPDAGVAQGRAARSRRTSQRREQAVIATRAVRTARAATARDVRAARRSRRATLIPSPSPAPTPPRSNPNPPHRNPRRRRRSSTAVEVIEILDSDDEGERAVPAAAVERALAEASAPAVEATSVAEPVADEASEKQCVICLSNLVRGDHVVTLPCMHVFHAACVLPHLRNSATPMCPNDRAPITRDDVKKLPVWKWGCGTAVVDTGSPGAESSGSGFFDSPERGASGIAITHDDVTNALFRSHFHIPTLSSLEWSNRQESRRR